AGQRARLGRDPVHWNVETRVARSSRRPEHVAQSQLFPASAAALEVRAPDLLRSRPERDHLLDDANGDGPIHASRVLDDRPECERAGLQTIEDGAFDIAGNEGRGGAAEHAPVENVLSAGRYEVVSSKAAAALTEVHDHRAMVLGWGSRGGRRIS